MTSHLDGKTVVVTGAASGFGALVAQRCANRGARVVGADVQEQALAAVIEQINAAGGQALAVTTDVASSSAMQALCRAAVAQFDQVDVWINNAGVMPLAFFSDHEQALDAWSRCIDINVKGVMHGIAACYDQMMLQGRGHVVNLSSIYGNHPVAGAGVYGATKAAVNFLSESLRVESQGKIKVTIVKPTGVPGTALGAGVINPEAIVGILGQNAPRYLQMMQSHMAGELPADYSDSDSIEYYALAPEHLADQVVYAIDQPWGVVIGDVTVRAAGDGYIL
ncbi:MAG: SDR family oxidoreductase [Pseudomonadales bacterium]